jgi:hypothetical protein
MAILNVISGPQDGLLKAARTMSERCTQFTEVVASVPRFQELVTGLVDLIARIDAAILAKQSSRFTSNITAVKNNSIASFADELDDLATVILDLTTESNNSDGQSLATRAMRTKTKYLSEEGLLTVAVEFMAFVKTIEPKLLQFHGVDAEEVQSLDVQISDIKTLRVKKEVTVDQKTLDNASVANLFFELKGHKAKMELLSNRFSKKSPEFFAAFQKATVVTLKLGIKTAKSETEKTPIQLLAKVAKKEATLLQKAAVLSKAEAVKMQKSAVKEQKAADKQLKAATKTKKSKVATLMPTTNIGAISATNGSNPATEATQSILVAGNV